MGYTNKTKWLKEILTIWDIVDFTDLYPYNQDGCYNSPFRTDRKPSFSVYSDGKLFRDFGTNDNGDVISFYRKATEKSFNEALYDLEGIALNKLTNMQLKSADTTKVVLRPQPTASFQMPNIPELTWNDGYAQTLSLQRGYRIDGLELAFERSIFGFCEYKGYQAWVVTDSAGICAQARRLDGSEWDSGVNAHKAETLKNSKCSYPIGLSVVADIQNIVLCEGSTDLLAAFHFMAEHECDNEIAPIAMLGASQNISHEYANCFEGKNILIFPDADTAGKEALTNWGDFLYDIAASVEYFDFSQFKKDDGTPVKDLCDFIALDPQQRKKAAAYANPFYELTTKG